MSWICCGEIPPLHTLRMDTSRQHNPVVSLARAVTNIVFILIHVFVAATCVCHDKTHLLSQQMYACEEKTFVKTNICRNKLLHDKRTVVVTKYVLCHGKHVFVATKITLVAAPANDTVVVEEDE